MLLNYAAKLPGALLGLSTLALLAGCNAEAESPPPVYRLQTQLIHEGSDNEFGAGHTPKTLAVLTTEEQYQAALLARNTEDNEAEIDFNHQSVILVDYGLAPTPGYSIEVTAVESESEDGPYQVKVFTSEPGDSCAGITVVASPYKFYVVEARSDELTFSESRETVEC